MFAFDCAHVCLRTEEKPKKQKTKEEFRPTLPTTDEQLMSFIHFKTQNKYQLGIGKIKMSKNPVSLSCLFKKAVLKPQILLC